MNFDFYTEKQKLARKSMYILFLLKSQVRHLRTSCITLKSIILFTLKQRSSRVSNKLGRLNSENKPI